MELYTKLNIHPLGNNLNIFTETSLYNTADLQHSETAINTATGMYSQATGQEMI